MASEVGRRVTTSDIARSLGVSRATVGYVLNQTPGQTISQDTRHRVLAEAARLGYRPHVAARALASGRSRIVLLVLPDWPLDFNLRRNIEEASLALDEAGYALITYTPHATGHARPLWETLQPDIVMALTAFTPEQISGIRAAGVTRIIPDPDAPPIVDEYREEGPGLQVKHLADLGHTRLAFAGSADPRVADLVALREQSAQETATALATPLASSALVDLTDGSTAPVLTRWLAEGVTGIVAYNDDVAAALVGAALRLGVPIPQRLAVIGHDDTPLASTFQPRLSTVHVDIVGLGRYLAQLALSAIEGLPAPDAGPVLHSTVVPRESTLGSSA